MKHKITLLSSLVITSTLLIGGCSLDPYSNLPVVGEDVLPLHVSEDKYIDTVYYKYVQIDSIDRVMDVKVDASDINEKLKRGMPLKEIEKKFGKTIAEQNVAASDLMLGKRVTQNFTSPSPALSTYLTRASTQVGYITEGSVDVKYTLSYSNVPKGTADIDGHMIFDNNQYKLVDYTVTPKAVEKEGSVVSLLFIKVKP